MPIAPDVYKKIVGAKVYIDQNFGEPINLDRLAREACLSRYHFHRLFTRVYQKTPHQYLTEKRIEQARQWLAAKDWTIVEICTAIWPNRNYKMRGKSPARTSSGVVPRPPRS